MCGVLSLIVALIAVDMFVVVGEVLGVLYCVLLVFVASIIYRKMTRGLLAFGVAITQARNGRDCFLSICFRKG